MPEQTPTKHKLVKMTFWVIMNRMTIKFETSLHVTNHDFLMDWAAVNSSRNCRFLSLWQPKSHKQKQIYHTIVLFNEFYFILFNYFK